jgi:hypothetical protein
MVRWGMMSRPISWVLAVLSTPHRSVWLRIGILVDMYYFRANHSTHIQGQGDGANVMNVCAFGGSVSEVAEAHD